MPKSPLSSISLLLSASPDGPFNSSVWRIPAFTLFKPGGVRNRTFGGLRMEEEEEEKEGGHRSGNETASLTRWRVGRQIGW